MEVLVNKIIKFSNVDGPGNRMAIFLQGCNLNCKYCHNPETINFCNNCGKCIEKCPTNALSFLEGKVIWDNIKCINCDNCIKVCDNSSSPKIIKYTIDTLFEEVLKVKNFIRGITFSGGECTLNFKFIAKFFSKIKNKLPNLTCFIDTNGYVDFSKEEYSDFLENTDFFMLDIKSYIESEHVNLTSKDNISILKNLELLIKMDKLYEVRTVVIENFLNNEKTIEEISNIIKYKKVKYKLIKFRNIGVKNSELESMKSPSDNYMESLKDIARNIGVTDILII